MRLELTLDPADAPHLPRLTWLKHHKIGRSRSRPVRFVWHDSPDGGLADRNLVLSEQRGIWRLEPLVPGEQRWQPGAPPPAIAEARSPAELPVTLPPALPPVATFEGRARSIAMSDDRGPVSLTILHGSVRSLVTDRAVCWLTLDGADAAVEAVAIKLAHDVAVGVPCASLAAEAICSARGMKPPPRRRNAPVLPPDLSVVDAYTHILGHLTDVILSFAADAASGEHGPEPVHQMRVAVRRLRSANRVFSRAMRCPAVDAADAGLKALAARLGPTRDWDVFITETAPAVQKAFPDDPRLRQLIAAAERHRRASQSELRQFLSSGEFARLSIELACLAGGDAWLETLGPSEQEQRGLPLAQFAGSTLDRRLKRLLQPGADLSGLDAATLHGIRLHAKRMRYAAEFFAPLYHGKATERFLKRLSLLQQRLGVLNDGVVAGSLLARLAGKNRNLAFAAGMVAGFLGSNRTETRGKVGHAWERFRKLPAFWD